MILVFVGIKHTVATYLGILHTIFLHLHIVLTYSVCVLTHAPLISDERGVSPAHTASSSDPIGWSLTHIPPLPSSG